jgi:hypothetical protein
MVDEKTSQERAMQADLLDWSSLDHFISFQLLLLGQLASPV